MDMYLSFHLSIELYKKGNQKLLPKILLIDGPNLGDNLCLLKKLGRCPYVVYGKGCLNLMRVIGWVTT